MRALALLVCSCVGAAGAQVTRATASVNGVTSARGFFNITVRLYQLDGVDWVKFDLVKSMVTIEFVEGKTATAQDVQRAMSAAGYRPGAVKIDQVEAPGEHDKRLGWRKIRRPTARSAVGQWFQLNF